MSRRWILWEIALAACVVLAACGGGEDDEADEEEDELNPAALVVAAVEKRPSRLPDGLTLTDVQVNSRWDDSSLATVDFLVQGPSGAEGYGVAVIFRDEAAARATLAEEVEGWDAKESKAARNHFCLWEGFSFYTNFDFEGVSVCVARSGSVYLEVEYGEVPEDKPEAALDLLLALERHIERLAEDATRRPRTVPPLAKAALFSSVPPPGPEGLEYATYNSFTTVDDGAGASLVGKSTWAGDKSTEEFAFIFAFDSAAAADAYRTGVLLEPKERDQTGCGSPRDPSFRQCAHQVEDMVVVTQRRVTNTSMPLDDARLIGWADSLTKYVTDIGAGKLPRAPRATPTPSGTRAPTASPARTATPTAAVPTRTPLPPIARFNAGRWTFDMVVSLNTCPSGLPAVGSTFRLEYEFTDSDGDGFIYDGEMFFIDQLLPRPAYLGGIAPTLPTATFVAEVANGSLTGLAEVNLGFTAVDEVFVDYVEYYDSCEIVAE